jgi:hypothetical protein
MLKKCWIKLVSCFYWISFKDDPIADLINSLSADVINFTSKFKFMDFKDSTFKLNELENYQQTIQRAQKIGYFVKKIVLTTWKTNDTIQKMQDSAIEKRTKLILDKENEEQIQDLNDFKLEKTLSRSQQERDLQEKEKIHNEKMLQFEFQEEQKRLQFVNERDTKFKREDLSIQLKSKIDNLQVEIDHLQKLKEFGVDLTKYLISKEEKANKIIKVDSNYNGKITLHE